MIVSTNLSAFKPMYEPRRLKRIASPVSRIESDGHKADHR